MVQCLPNPLDFYSPVFLVTHPCGGDEIIIIFFFFIVSDLQPGGTQHYSLTAFGPLHLECDARAQWPW